MKTDGDPSRRYMRMLIKGASEIRLDPDYQIHLKNVPTARPPKYLCKIAINHMFFTSWMFRTKKRAGEMSLNFASERITNLI